MASKSAVISVIGSLNVDLVTRVKRMPVGGETLTGESFDIGYGGKGANQAVACARLSRTQAQASSKQASDIEVRMVGAVGDDQYSTGFLESLAKDGLVTDRVEAMKGQKTGVAVIIVETTTGQNRIMLCPGANGEVPVKDLVEGDEAVALFQLELPLEVVCPLEARNFIKALLIACTGHAQHEDGPGKGRRDHHQPCPCNSSPE